MTLAFALAFSGKGTAHTVGYRHVNVDPPRLPVAPPLWHVVSTMLAKDPTLRLSATATADALRELPSEVLGADPLPVQPAPEQWEESARTSVRAAPIRVQATPADLDVGATNLHGIPDEQAPLAGTGSVEALTPDAGGPDDDSTTRLGTPARRHTPAKLVPAAGSEETEAAPGRRRWPWVVAVLAVLVVLSVVLVLTGVLGSEDDGGGGGAPDAGPDPSAITATSRGQSFASGLQVESAAEYDAAAGTATLTLTYEAGGTPLSGELMQVLPPAPGETTCPAVEWSGAPRANAINPTVSGLSVRCGWNLEVGTIEAPVEVTAIVYVDLDPSSEALQQWLDSAEEATTGSLDAIPAGYDYVLQRIEGIAIEVNSVTRRSGSTPIPYSVLPVWASGIDRVSPLFRSPTRGSPTGALRSVAGGGLEAVDVDVCRGAVLVGVDLVADYAERDCQLAVTLGELSDETTFDILPSGS